jgi:hypothetical protein
MRKDWTELMGAIRYVKSNPLDQAPPDGMDARDWYIETRKRLDAAEDVAFGCSGYDMVMEMLEKIERLEAIAKTPSEAYWIKCAFDSHCEKLLAASRQSSSNLKKVIDDFLCDVFASQTFPIYADYENDPKEQIPF